MSEKKGMSTHDSLKAVSYKLFQVISTQQRAAFFWPKRLVVHEQAYVLAIPRGGTRRGG